MLNNNGFLHFMANMGQVDICKCNPVFCRDNAESRRITGSRMLDSEPSICRERAFADGYGQCVVLVYATGVRYSNKRKLKKHTDRITTEIEERGEMIEAVRNSE